jgi:Zn-dependent protease with chaperone function
MAGPGKVLVVSSFTVLVFMWMLAGCAAKPAELAPYEPTRDPVLEQSLVQELEGMNPQAVPVYQQATRAMDAGDYTTALPMYEQVVSLAPNFSTAYRRMGYIEMYDAAHLDEAITLERKAVALDPNAYNQSSLAEALLRRGTPSDKQEAFNLASSAVQQLPDDDESLAILVMASGTVNNQEVMRQTNAHLLTIVPNHPIGLFYGGLIDAEDGKWEKAEAELLQSQAQGISADNVQHALNSGIHRNAMLVRSLRWGGAALAAWLLGLLGLYLVGNLLSRATLRSLAKLEPTVGAQLQPSERRIRSTYRAVIAVLSLYFYVSIPFVVLALILLVGGAYYLFMLIGSIPIQLAAFLAVLLFFSLFAILRSLFVRRKEVQPGREVSRGEAPELWRLAEAVARKLETRPVDSIFVMPYAGIAVNESGSMLRKMRAAGHRNLLLGMGTLPGLTQGELAAILAHEYGHFNNRDTAGGDLAHLVYASLSQLAMGLRASRTARIYNPAWLFVVTYQRIFLRVTLGASRLQEVLADRFAVMAYGRTNFVDGLQKIIRQTIAFELQANFEIRRSLELNRPISNLYQLPMDEKLCAPLEERFAVVMKQKATMYDSHPSPQERIELIDRIRTPYAFDQDNPSPALDLFPNSEELQQQLTADLMKKIKR